MNEGMTMSGTTMGNLYATGYQAPGRSGAATYPVAGNSGLMRSFACYLAAGTMGLLTPQAVESLYAKRTSFAPVHYNIKGARNEAPYDNLERSSADDLARIREVLKPTMLELASVFGVSRQTVYDWQQGSQPVPQTTQRLAQLARVADIFAEAKVSVDAKTLRRRVAGVGTLLDVISNGGDAESMAQSLAGTLNREASQRERLQAQLAGRKRAPANPSDFGAPTVSENV